jgi:ubiquinone/menaquinone biosynthesis C-methylase UbiE
MKLIFVYHSASLLSVVMGLTPGSEPDKVWGITRLRGGDDAAAKDDDSPSSVSKTMYNKQASNWVRTEPRCLSDFTGRPVVFELLEPEVKGKTVLDVGCGEGYCARKIVELGASKVIGLDISKEMVQNAIETSKGDDRFHYFSANSLSLLEGLTENLGIDQPEGSVDVAMAVFLFNYLASDEMETVIGQIYKALKSEGVFVFSVPHPSMIYCHDKDAIFRLASEGKGYFSSRNQKLLGHISTIDGTKLNIMSVHKTLTDYIQAIQKAGFVIEELKEACVTEEHMHMNPDFFESVNDRPLHLVFKLKKP